MAHRGLAVASLGQRAPERRIKEDRVVAKSAGPPGFRCNPAFHDTTRLKQDPAVPHECQRTYETSRAPVSVAWTVRAKPSVNEVEFLSVTTLRASEARRLDPG